MLELPWSWCWRLVLQPAVPMAAGSSVWPPAPAPWPNAASLRESGTSAEGERVERGKVSDVVEPMVQHCESQKGEGLWKRGVKLSSYSIRLCCRSSGSALLPVDGTTTAKYVINLEAGKGKEYRYTVRMIITVFIRK